MNDPGAWWVRAQMPLVTFAVAWPVVQHLTNIANEWPSALQWPSRFVGAVGVVASIGIFLSARRVLADDLIASPVPRAGGTLRTRAIYSRIRHPIYAAIVLCSLAWPLVLCSSIGLLVGGCCMVFFSLKSRAEEKFLRERFGQYDGYAARVPRFIPKLRR